MATSTTTAAALLEQTQGRYAYVIVFEGVGLALTTTDDIAGISASWSATSWKYGTGSGGTVASADEDALWLPVAFYPGQTSQEVKFLEPRIKVDSMSLRVLDPDDILAGLVWGNTRSAHQAFLSADLSNSATAIACDNTAGFPTAAGAYTIWCGQEAIQVDGSNNTGTGWSTSRRSVWAFHQTSSAGRFAPRHAIDTTSGSAPPVTSAVVTWYNRSVRIYLHHYELGSGWSSAAQAVLVWEGAIHGVADDGNRCLTFAAVDAKRCLVTSLLREQFTADVRQGFYIDSVNNWFRLTEYYETAEEVVANTIYSGTVTGSRWYNADQAIAALNAAMAPGVSGTTFTWSFLRRDAAAETYASYVQITVDPGPSLPTPPISSGMILTISHDMADGLGWSSGWAWSPTEDTEAYAHNAIWFNVGAPEYGTYWYTIAPARPLCYGALEPVAGVLTLNVENVTGSFIPQPSLSTKAFIRIVDAWYSGLYDYGASTLTLDAVYSDDYFYGKLAPGVPVVSPLLDSPKRENEIDVIRAYQIWYETGALKDVLLRALLSTGTAAYNHATYDVNGAGMGAGVPYTLIDAATFEDVGSFPWAMFLVEPTEFAKVIESMLAVTGRYVVWRNGKLALVEPNFDPATIAAAVELTEANKARLDDRARPEYAVDVLLNRVEFKYGKDLKGDFKGSLIVGDVMSASHFGVSRASAIEVWGVRLDNAAGIAAMRTVAADTLAYWSRPMTALERTINRTLASLCPGDTVLLTDPYVVDPATGQRGITERPAWVTQVSFDWGKMTGSVRIVFPGEAVLT